MRREQLVVSLSSLRATEHVLLNTVQGTQKTWIVEVRPESQKVQRLLYGGIPVLRPTVLLLYHLPSGGLRAQWIYQVGQLLVILRTPGTQTAAVEMPPQQLSNSLNRTRRREARPLQHWPPLIQISGDLARNSNLSRGIHPDVAPQ